MGLTMSVSDGGLPSIPEGEYKAKFVSYEVKEGLLYGDAVKLNCEIVDGDFKGTVLNALVSKKLSAQSRLGGAVRAFTGKPLKAKQEVDLDKLIGSVCVIVVKTEPGKGEYADFSTIIEFKALSGEKLPF